ncbi:hypothetical protein [Solilutibacter silvestris]|uniref:hypothetical protein n=1 Tax=Solilutibacter silvestris TaxID=1645665 RepID=UPI003D337C00
MPDNHWAEAFSALPTETPEPMGWERLQARLPASTPDVRRSWPRWLAAAAVLAIAVAIPLALMRPALPPAAKSNVVKTVVPTPDTTPAAVMPAANPIPEPAPARSRHVATAVKASHASPTRRIATGDALEPLYRQSAQLETLLSMARDEQVAGGVSTALSDDLGAQISRIDNRLSQPDLQPQQRAALWHQRIDTLQQLVGIAATDRLYSARGQRHDAVLVSID